MDIIARLIKNPRTTIGGTAAGALMLTAGGAIISQAGCHFSDVEWMGILTMLFAGPAVVGGLATDSAKGA